MRVRLGVLLAAACGTLSICAAEASAAALEFCERTGSGRSCATLTVPLDRSGAAPGSVKLRIERRKAKRSTRPPLFLLAGGPGQSAIEAFDDDTVERYFGTEIRSRDVVVMDLRGTGRSGALDCPALQRGSTRPADVAACAVKLGARREFHSSIDIADDIDAVRAALGVERIAIYGISYGTYVAQVYARRYPTRVDRLVLDSVVGPTGVDAFERPSMAAVPRVLAQRCGKRACRSFTRDPGGDVARLAARLDRRPLTGHVVDSRGRRHRRTIDGRGLLDAVAGGDLGLSGPLEQLPGAVRSALRGDAAPLLRARALAVRSSAPPRSPRSLSAAAYVATLCSDVALPWGTAVPVAGRQVAAEALVAGLPPAAFAPFGPRTALNSAVIEACRAWPSGSAAAPALGPLPDVPALLLAGGIDVRTPLESARAVAAQMPQASVVAVANSGHGVLGWGMEGCPSRATRRFLAGGAPGRCGPGTGRNLAMPPLPRTLADLPGGRGPRTRARRTAQAVAFTILDGAVALTSELFVRLATVDATNPFAALTDEIRVGGLRGGTYAMSVVGPRLTFRSAQLVRGVRVTGRLRAPREIFKGRLRISGPAAAAGYLEIRRDSIVGRLGGRRVDLSPRDLPWLGDARAEAAQIARVASASKLVRGSSWGR